jgi:choline transport protein
VAFNAIISLQLMALMATYNISIGCVLYQRVFNGGANLPYARWSLGRWGIIVNTIGFFYSLQVLFWVPWPSQGGSALTLQNMNWASVMFVGVIAISLLYYAIWARHNYKGPVVLVRHGYNVPSRTGGSNHSQ